MKLAKYFWELKRTELVRTRSVLRDPADSRFAPRMMTLLSRCDRPKELFTIVPRRQFIETWPRVRSYWTQRERRSAQRDWWETLYEQLTDTAVPRASDRPAAVFQTIGRVLREKRIEQGLNQNQLAQRTHLSQPVISAIEEGKKNITLFTLIRLCKVLGVRSIDIP